MVETAQRYGRVMIRAGFVHGIGGGWRYQDVLVAQEPDGCLYYFHGGPTCRTADGWVTLPAEYAAEVRWNA